MNIDNKNMYPLISIIIPLYNSEKYIGRALDSLIKQDINDIEVVIVDDGSTDLSYKIACDYKKKVNNIHVYHQNNSGVASARNLGIEKSKGRYIAFMDSDDDVNSEFCKTLKTAVITNNDVDMFIFGLQEVLENNDVVNVRTPAKSRNILLEDSNDIFELFEKNLLPVTWNKITSRKFIGNTRFKDLIIGEDYQFYLDLLSKQPTIRVLHDILYNYHVAIENSAMKHYDAMRFLTLKNQQESVIRLMKKEKLDSNSRNRILEIFNFRSRNYMIMNFINSSNSNPNFNIKKEVMVMKKTNKQFTLNLRNIFFSKYLKNSMKVKLLIVYYPNIVTMNILKIMYLYRSKY
ncbi:glycosyltransferase family 2 protein [Latilactobacillus curvatus]|uniref:glycosyltransferase family 2 protein n=1 Tax=Latilactobacillus curvatus TaxID=28038 RepID=UPI000FEC9C38|nr:glycosyltransferase family 2 protein [Latilactobacillus curvatus]QAR35029.1 glycosyltransferase family 2 protein [Latilactobacillus curvatus]